IWRAGVISTRLYSRNWYSKGKSVSAAQWRQTDYRRLLQGSWGNATARFPIGGRRQRYAQTVELRLLSRPATVDDDRLPGDVARCGRGEKGGNPDQLIDADEHSLGHRLEH